MKHDDYDYENFFNVDNEVENVEENDDVQELNEEELDEFEKDLERFKNKPMRQDDWSDAEDTECDYEYDDIYDICDEINITPEDERLSKQLVTQLKIESLDDEFIDKDRIKLIKKKLNAHIAANPHADIIDICSKMISYRDKKIHKSEKNNENN
jgi:hypothetical protein